MIFVSSVQSEFTKEREAIREYVRGDAILSKYFREERRFLRLTILFCAGLQKRHAVLPECDRPVELVFGRRYSCLILKAVATADQQEVDIAVFHFLSVKLCRSSALRGMSFKDKHVEGY
jgi:hypothetical protein